jgi:ferrochelatase
MRYGEPSIGSRAGALRAEGVRSVRGAAAVSAVLDHDHRQRSPMWSRAMRRGLHVRFIDDYPVDPGWVAAVADSIRAHWANTGAASTCCSRSTACRSGWSMAAIPTAQQCEASTRRHRAGAGLRAASGLLTFQSRFGKERWLQPYTTATLEALAREGVRTGRRGLPRFRGGLPGDAGGNRDAERRAVPRGRRRGAALHPVPQCGARACRRAGGAGARGDEGWS